MKSYLPLLAIAALLASCSSAYKSGQTPDDVYFSPERPQDEYVRVEKRNDDRRYGNDELDREDRYLRMKVNNRRYGLLDDYNDYYAYNGSNYYRYSDYYRMNNYNYYLYNRNGWMWNNGYTYWNHNPYYYNPYYCSPYYAGVVYGNITPQYNKPRTSNLHVFDRDGNTYSPNVPRNNGRTFNSSRNDDNYRGSGTNAGGFLRDVFGGSNNNSSSAGKTSVGSSSNNNNSSSGSSNSGSSSSGSSRAPVRKF